MIKVKHHSKETSTNQGRENKGQTILVLGDGEEINTVPEL